MARSEVAPKTSRLVGLASLCVVVAALYFARDVLVPVALALLLTFLLTPGVHRIERMGVPRVGSVLFVVAFSFAILGGIGWLISNQATELAIKLGDYQNDIEHKIESLQSRVGHGALAEASRKIDQMAMDVATSRPSTNSAPASWINRGTAANPLSVKIAADGQEGTTLKTIASALALVAPMAQSLIVIVFVIFMLIQREDIRDRVIRLVGQGQLTVTTQALDDAATRISRYLLAQSGINGVYGVLLGLGLYLIHVPNAPLWGLLVALLRFIPYLGIWIGAAVPIILSMVVPEGYYTARPFLTIGLFVFLEIVTANIAEPVLFGSSTGVSPIAILVAAVFWTWLWGWVGLLLSTPMTVLLAVAGKYVPQMSYLDILLGDQPVLEPPERYYQRLLAEDSEEAEDLIEEFGKTHDLEQVYSQVVLPALQMTERDHRRAILGDDRHEFILQAMKDQVETYRRPASNDAPVDGASPVVPKDCVVNVLCLAARGQADEIVGLMLANLLLAQGYKASCLPAGTLASERVESIGEMKADLVAISALPPGAVGRARYLCTRINARFPELQLMVGLWNAGGDLEKAKNRFAPVPGAKFVTQLGEAVTLIQQMAQPLILRGGLAEGRER